MNIALFASAFYPSLGGVEELSLRLAQTALEGGHCVRVYTERWPRRLPAVDEVEGVEVRRFAFRVPHARGVKPKLTWAAMSGLTRRKLIGDLREFSADVIHIQCVSPSVDYAIPSAKRLGVPLVVTLQGELSMDASGVYLRPGHGQRRMFRALDAADAITACSGQTLAEAEKFYIDRGGETFGGRARVIYNGINLERFKGVDPVEHDKPFVFALGRHVPQKGFDVLIRAMAQLPESLDLLLAGDGPDRESLERLAEQLGLSGRVRFLGRLDPAWVRRYMHSAVVFVLPSRHEPFGIVNLEAMASGTPVVATRVGGVPEFVKDGQTGWLVAAEDVDELVSAISRVITDTERARLVAEQAIGVVAGHDWGELFKHYMLVYRDAGERTCGMDTKSGTVSQSTRRGEQAAMRVDSGA